MQVSATLIAAQQAAREARARLNIPQAASQAASQAPASKASFTSALQAAGGPSDAFAPLPLKQTAAPSPAQPAAAPQPGARMGSLVNILV